MDKPVNNESAKLTKEEKRLQKQALAYSKRMIEDNRPLLWIITIGGLLLAVLCVLMDFQGSLPWVAGMVSAVWASNATVESFYLNMAKADHSKGHITYDAAAVQQFGIPINNNINYEDSNEGESI